MVKYSPSECVDSSIKAAIKAFKNHELIYGNDTTRRWRIATRYSNLSVCGNYASEVVSLWGGRLLSGGDIDDCVFGYYSDTREHADPEFHLRKLRWIGRCSDMAYVTQKASIGLTDCNIVRVWDANVARYELQALLDNEYYDWDIEDREVLKEAMNICEDGAAHTSMYLSENAQYKILEAIGDLGYIIAPRVIYAWAACRKVCQLLWGPMDDDPYVKYEL